MKTFQFTGRTDDGKAEFKLARNDHVWWVPERSLQYSLDHAVHEDHDAAEIRKALSALSARDGNAQRESIEATSTLIQAARLVGGKFSPRQIQLPCGRALKQVPGTRIWFLEQLHQVHLNPTSPPQALAAAIRKLLVRHDDFLLTNPKKASKFSTKQH